MSKILFLIQRYLCEGQFKENQGKEGDEVTRTGWRNAWVLRTFLYKRPRLVALFLPLVLVWTIWICCMSSLESEDQETWKLFPEKYYMSITMFFGSMIAGGTSEGGASVAFPVMTLIFGIEPATARDFSLLIQSVGMTSASFTLLYMRIRIEKDALLYGSLGGAAGMMFGLVHVSGKLPAPISKMLFVSVWLGFAASLFWLNRIHGRYVHMKVQFMSNWKICVLLWFGFVGGILSSISGSGLDICTFACLTLLFRVSEKVATPTSVVLMAINSLFGVLFKVIFLDGFPPLALEFWAVCVPVVVIGAPLGSFLSSFVHRIIYSLCIYITDVAQFIGALVVVKQTPLLVLMTCLIVVVAIAVFSLLAWFGEKMLIRNLVQLQGQGVLDERGLEELQRQNGPPIQLEDLHVLE